MPFVVLGQRPLFNSRTSSKGKSSKGKKGGTHDNVVLAVSELIRRLNVRVTTSSIQELVNHPSYPSLAAISESLTEWNIPNLSVQLTPAQLSEIPCPAIAHLRQNSGHFVVIEEVIGGEVRYTDPAMGPITETLEEFQKHWTGVLLLVEPNSKSGEIGYAARKRAESLEVLRSKSIFIISILVIAAVLINILLFAVGFTFVSILLLKCLGLYVSILLLQNQLDINSPVASAICGIGKKSDCVSVLRSPASKLFGIPMSDLGFVYFAGGILSLLFSLSNYNAELGMLPMLTYATLPYTFFSFYYQWRVVKKWCVLCLATLVIFWLEFLIVFPAEFRISVAGVVTLVLSFGVVTILWLNIRPLLVDSLKVPLLEKALINFKRNPKIFNAILASEPVVVPPLIASHSEHSSPTFSLIVVSNPECIPCARAHFQLEEYLNRLSVRPIVHYVFLVDTASENIPKRVAAHIINQSKRFGNDKLEELMRTWYLRQEKASLEGWVNDPSFNDDDVQSLVEHRRWCADNGVEGTPTFFINGRKVPKEYHPRDIFFYLMHNRVI